MQITPAICLLQRCCILHFKLFFVVGIDFYSKLWILWISYIGTMESNEYNNAKKIIEVKEATYAAESLN